MSDVGSENGTVVHRSDVSTLPPMFLPAWKATPARGRDRFNALGGDMFSPMKLQQIFHEPSPSSMKENVQLSSSTTSSPRGPASKAAHAALEAVPTQSEFTFRTKHVPTSTPMPTRRVSVKGATLNAALQAEKARAEAAAAAATETATGTTGSTSVSATRTSTTSASTSAKPVPSTPGGPHVPLRLINLQMDAHVRTGLEQLAEERSREASRDESSSIHDLHTHTRMRVASHETSQTRPVSRRMPLSYRSTNMDTQTSPPHMSPFGSYPRSILKSTAQDTPRGTNARSISFVDPSVPRESRLERVLDELEHMNLTQSMRGDMTTGDRSLGTQASFRVTRDKLIELLTDVAPWEPDWHSMRTLDLRARRLESCIGLAEHMPALDEVWLDHNDVAFAMGLPASLRILRASHNHFSELTSFEHLQRLEVIDVSHNDLTSLMPFAQLPHLRELRADHNRIVDLHGLEQCRTLRRVSVTHNALHGTLDLASMAWHAIERIALSHNRLQRLDGMEHLSTLQALHVEANELSVVRSLQILPQLRVLRVSDNATLTTLDVAWAPRIKTLYADRCALPRIEGLAQAVELQRLSLRQQHTRLQWPLPLPPSVERLFLAGNAIRSHAWLGTTLPDLVYLELAGCQLTHMAAQWQQRTPALRSLNLDHNMLTSVPSLHAWHRLKRLSVVGNRLVALEDVVQSVRGLTELCVLDVRMNPCTLGLYPPMVWPCDAGVGPRDDAVKTPPTTTQAWCPPLPNPAIVQPDAAAALARAAQAQYQAAQALAERSQFHKRTMLLPPEPSDTTPGSDHAADGARATVLFQAADQRFVATLTRHTLQKRRVYRGLCGMACASLTWLDGLELEERDVQEAEQQLRSTL